MDLERSSQSRNERLIASLRLLVAAGLPPALAFDPEAAPYRTAGAFALSGAFILYALLLAVLFWTYDRIELRSRLPVHVLDLAAFAALSLLSGGAVPAALVFFALLLLAGALRWGWRGAAGTALAGIAVHVGMGLSYGRLAGDPVSRAVAGGVWMGLLALLLASVAAYQQRLGRETFRVAAWPRSSLRDADALLSHLLGQAAAVLRAPRVLLAWEEVDEPWLYLAHWSAGRLERLREAPPDAPLVPPPLTAASFLANGAGEAWVLSGGEVERWRGAAVEEGLARRFGVRRAASWPVRGEIVEGRLFALDRKSFERDDLVVGEIVAVRIAAELDQFYLTRQARTAAVSEERIRLACDLHDGLLQSLTGTALQLQALARLMEEDPAAARGQLLEVQRLIASDQRDLRFFIEELKPASRSLSGQADLRSRLEELSARIERLWGLRIDVRLEGVEGQVSEAFTRQLYRLLREAMFNVARHAGAGSARVEVSRQDRGLSITVTDDGRGFPFRGRYEHEELTRQKLGPVSLKERISALGGSLAIDSGPGLTRLEMHLPTAGGAK